MTKDELRDKMLALRDAIPERDIAKRSKAICSKIADLELFRRARHVLFYYPVRSEVSLLPLMGRFLVYDQGLESVLPLGVAAWPKRKIVYLPRIDGDTFHATPVTDLDLLEEGEFGIPQPPHVEGGFDDRIDLVLVPGLAFTERGDRLGMGKGYYDRYLKRLCNIPKLGVAFSEQILERLPIEPHDQRLDGLIEG